MLFNSFEFFVFLPLVFILYWFVFNKKRQTQNALILVASYFFYGWWSWKFLLLLILSTVLDYFYGFGVAPENRRRRKLFLWLSIINNLGILGVFKYYNFFALELERVFSILGTSINPVFLQVALPVGISFYTFHGMSYVFDIYRGLRKPVTNIVDYAVFVCFFPLLVAGPIERANRLLPQVHAKRVFNYGQAVGGCRLILWGLFKKVVIADSLARLVDKIFDNYHQFSSPSLILGAVGFSFQIYADFSGYTDIALGTAKLFGFELLSNFKFPYFSRDIAEFWRRWHVSLSSWFRDYLYIPLGGSKNGKLKAVRNTFILFLVSGFWHGANLNFIVWGGIHACGFMPLLLLGRNRKHTNEIVASDRKLPSLREVLQMIATFAFVTFAWIFFRIHSLRDGVGYAGALFRNGKHPGDFVLYKEIFVYAVVIIVIDWWLRRDERTLRSFPLRIMNWTIYVLFMVLIYLKIDVSAENSFIYFQF